MTPHYSHGGLPAHKALLRMLQRDLGGVRLPLSNLSDEKEGALRAELEKTGLFAAL